VVDAVNMLNDFKSMDVLAQRKLGVSKEDKRPISLLLIDQIEVANVIIVNKSDLVSPQQLQEVTSSYFSPYQGPITHPFPTKL
jgi:G3E family GTPase